MAEILSNFTAYPSTVSVGTVVILPFSRLSSSWCCSNALETWDCGLFKDLLF